MSTRPDYYLDPHISAFSTNTDFSGSSSTTKSNRPLDVIYETYIIVRSSQDEQFDTNLDGKRRYPALRAAQIIVETVAANWPTVRIKIAGISISRGSPTDVVSVSGSWGKSGVICHWFIDHDCSLLDRLCSCSKRNLERQQTCAKTCYHHMFATSV